MNKLMDESSWVEKHLNNDLGGWQELIVEGYAKPENLQPGELRTAIEEYLTLHARIEEMLENLNYEQRWI